MEQVEFLRRIREQLKRSMQQFLDQLRRERPAESLYAVMFEVDVSDTYILRIAATEESLTRLAEKYAAKGYRVRSGELMTALRVMSRWDAPGDSQVGWYWGNQDDDRRTCELIGEAIGAGVLSEYDESQRLRQLCIEALQELDAEHAFGLGADRERLLIGPTCVEVGFCESEEAITELATLNPPATIIRLRHELEAAVVADKQLIRPWEEA